MSTSKSPIDSLAELASAVVQKMYEKGLNASSATLEVIVERKLDFGESAKLSKKAQEIFNKQPELADHLKHVRRAACRRPVPTRFWSHSSYTHEALARKEA